MFLIATLFMALIPVGFWAAGWAINKPSIQSLCLPALLWFWYFRLRQIDRKLREAKLKKN